MAKDVIGKMYLNGELVTSGKLLEDAFLEILNRTGKHAKASFRTEGSIGIAQWLDPDTDEVIIEFHMDPKKQE